MPEVSAERGADDATWRCVFDRHAPAVALWQHTPSQLQSALCRRHLDVWLDLADDDDREPAALTWIESEDVDRERTR